MKKIFSFLLIALLSISAHAEIIQYSPIKPSSGAAQSPWTGNINGSTHYLYNADIRDPAQNPLLDTNNRILNNAYSTGVLDFSGNISNTAGFSFNGNNPVFNAYIEDGNGLKSLNANSSRELFAADGSNQILTWAGTGQDSSYIVSFDTNNAYIRSDLTLGYGGSLHLASGGGGSIDGVNQITAGSFYGDGSNLTNLPLGGTATSSFDLSNTYSINNADNVSAAHFFGDGSSISGLSYSNLSGAPIDSGGNVNTNLNMNFSTFNMGSNTFYTNGVIVSNGNSSFSGDVITAVCGSQNGMIHVDNGIITSAQDCVP